MPHPSLQGCIYDEFFKGIWLSGPLFKTFFERLFSFQNTQQSTHEFAPQHRTHTAKGALEHGL